MLIQEAVKSGKPFRRINETTYLVRICEFTIEDSSSAGMNCIYAESAGGLIKDLSLEDILSDDWEVK